MVFFFVVNFMFFKDSYDGYQVDIVDGGGVQCCKGVGLVGQVEDWGVVGDYFEIQFGEVIVDQIGEGVFDFIGGVDCFFWYEIDGGDVD